ncbi:B-4DMT family transporter [Rhodococcus sp. IEGM 1406]|uniref:B-4DMT family transporter n=1 Tax=Rhodococcus sp. IEGM 1406 TaxID=3047083 RepID=UPI0024B7BA31|nr:B-4DMT family transporter [Rhodococcus sp. IEGM 1406]MDI9906096.1 B-4DMT family transporter [Rhodococcus sp. IEGM 1406]
MNAWLVRGLGMALIHVVFRALLGAAIAQWPLQGSTLRWLSLLIVIVFAAIWGGIDGIGDRRNFPEPEDGADLTMLWLKAALVGGFVAGAASWALSLVPSLELTQQGLFFEVTSGAAFTILLIFVPAMIAITVGRFFVSREQRKNGTAPQTPSHERHHEPVPVSEGYDSPTEQHAYSGAAMSVEESDADTAVFPAIDLGKREQ